MIEKIHFDDYMGRTVKKVFKDLGVFSGRVASCDENKARYIIIYDDGDREELDTKDMLEILC